MLVLNCSCKSKFFSDVEKLMADHSLHVIAGYFAEPSNAKRALESLKTAGFAPSNLNFVMRPGEDDASSESVSAEHYESASGLWRNIVDFMQADVPFDPYSKDKVGSESYRIAGQPCHGGYEYEHAENLLEAWRLPAPQARYFANRFVEGEKGAVVCVATADRQLEATGILKNCEGECGEDTAAHAKY
jgi:hypothetical protein